MPQTPIQPTREHLSRVPDFMPVSEAAEKAKRLRIKAGSKGKTIHVFKVQCADSRGRSQRVENSSHVLHEIYRKAGNTVHTHTLEIAGSTLFPDQIDIIKNEMLRLRHEAGDKAGNLEFHVEIIGHSGLTGRGSAETVKTDPECGYHCGFTGGDHVAHELQEELMKNYGLADEKALREFMGVHYKFYGNIHGPGGKGYIYGIPDPKDHMVDQYRILVKSFGDFIKDGIISKRNLATYLHDFRDHYLVRIRGGKGGWSEKVHAIAQLDEGQEHYGKRTEKQNPTIMAITHPDAIHRSTVPLMALEGLGPEFAPGKVFVNAVYGLEKGIVGPSTQAGIYYYARHLKGKVLHVRGKSDAESRDMVSALLSDPITGMIIKNYGLTVHANSSAKENEIIAAMHGN